MAQSTKQPIFDVIDIEREIEEEFRKVPSNREPQPTEFAPPPVSAPDLAMPDYVEHRAGATEIGKLSAEAVVREYEAAAKDIEDLGVELVGHVKQCEAMSREALNVIEELKETAARYREEAKRVFLHIENCSLVTAQVRRTCAEMKDKIAVSARIETKAKEK
jgi:chromatin segregation and condensation protein Rec8/ScpA/Scc1 (kleisin family)